MSLGPAADEHFPTEVSLKAKPRIKQSSSQQKLNEVSNTDVSLPLGSEKPAKLPWREKKTDRAADKHDAVTALIATDASRILV